MCTQRPPQRHRGIDRLTASPIAASSSGCQANLGPNFAKQRAATYLVPCLAGTAKLHHHFALHFDLFVVVALDRSEQVRRGILTYYLWWLRPPFLAYMPHEVSIASRNWQTMLRSNALRLTGDLCSKDFGTPSELLLKVKALMQDSRSSGSRCSLTE